MFSSCLSVSLVSRPVLSFLDTGISPRQHGLVVHYYTVAWIILWSYKHYDAGKEVLFKFCDTSNPFDWGPQTWTWSKTAVHLSLGGSMWLLFGTCLLSDRHKPSTERLNKHCYIIYVAMCGRPPPNPAFGVGLLGFDYFGGNYLLWYKCYVREIPEASFAFDPTLKR